MTQSQQDISAIQHAFYLLCLQCLHYIDVCIFFIVAYVIVTGVRYAFRPTQSKQPRGAIVAPEPQPQPQQLFTPAP